MLLPPRTALPPPLLEETAEERANRIREEVCNFTIQRPHPAQIAPSNSALAVFSIFVTERKFFGRLFNF